MSDVKTIKKRGGNRFYTTRLIALGFLAMILLGAGLLTLPCASAAGQSIGFFKALFTATSAVCVTGLSVLETGIDFSTFGQVVIISLIQVGGLGFMTIITLIFVALGRKITIRDRLLIQESMNENNIGGMVRLILWVMKMTFACEFAGAALLACRFIPDFGWGRGIYMSVFHAISAFCNAGFDILGDGASLARYVNDPIVSLVISALVITGGLGFGVINDVRTGRRFQKFCLHTKLVLVSTGVLITLGTLLVLLFEWNNPETLGGMNFFQKLLAAFFQSMTYRTAGFATLSQGALTSATKFMGCALMFVGAAPASTGGGIKITTMAVLALTTATVVRGRESVNVFGRSVPREIIQRALAIFIIGMTVMLTDTVLIAALEPGKPLLDVLYECVSALGTVGLTSIGTSNFCAAAQAVIILTMFIGRIGPLSMTLAIAHRQQQSSKAVHRPEERIVVG